MRSLLWRWFGFLGLDREDGLRFTWLQVVWSPGIGAKIQLWRNDSDRWRWGLYLHLLLVKVYLKLWSPRKQDWKDDSFSGLLWWWGFDWTWSREWHSTFWFGWPGKKRTCYDMPWAWTYVGTWYVNVDGDWIRESHHPALGKTYIHWTDDPAIWTETFPYTYKLKSGKIQSVSAKVCQRRTEWVWKIFKRWNIGPRKVCHALDIEFSGEVGERAGSWKGGCIGYSWELKFPGEEWETALRRMEAVRRF